MAKIKGVNVPLDSFNGISYASMTPEQLKNLAVFPEIKAGYDIWFAANEGKRYIAMVETQVVDAIVKLSAMSLKVNDKTEKTFRLGTYQTDFEVLKPVIDEKTGEQKENGLYYTLTLQVSDKRGPLSVRAVSSGTRAPNGARPVTVNEVPYKSINEALTALHIDLGQSRTVSGDQGILKLIKAGFKVVEV